MAFVNAEKQQSPHVSMLIGNKHIVLGEYFQDIVVFFYSPDVPRDYLFKNFIECGLEHGSRCFCASPYDQEFLENSQTKQNLHLFTLTKEDINKVLGELQYFLSTKTTIPLLIVVDFANIANTENINSIIRFMEKLPEQKGRATLGAIIAFDISSLDAKMLNQLINRAPKVIFSTGAETTLSITKSLARNETVGELFTNRISEKFIKDSLETVILSMLLSKPMSGSDVIKQIAHDYHVVLSQGTVYPVLYSLKEKGILEVTQHSKTKIYSPLVEKKNQIKKQLEEVSNAYSYLIGLSSFRIGGD